MSASPGMLRATAESVFRLDVRPILPTLTAPTLVIHARDDPLPETQRPGRSYAVGVGLGRLVCRLFQDKRGQSP
jgi:pimeloyl-ACP methyl ester carboxylesterase